MLQVWSGVAHVLASLPGPGRVELFALKPAGRPLPLLRVEAYGADSLVAAGDVAVWELNQAIAALLASGTQARRLSLRSPVHGGYLDVVADPPSVDVVATARDGRRVTFTTRAEWLVADLNALVRHYLALTRAAGATRTIVLPASAGAAADGAAAETGAAVSAARGPR